MSYGVSQCFPAATSFESLRAMLEENNKIEADRESEGARAPIAVKGSDLLRRYKVLNGSDLNLVFFEEMLWKQYRKANMKDELSLMAIFGVVSLSVPARLVMNDVDLDSLKRTLIYSWYAYIGHLYINEKRARVGGPEVVINSIKEICKILEKRVFKCYKNLCSQMIVQGKFGQNKFLENIDSLVTAVNAAGGIKNFVNEL